MSGKEQEMNQAIVTKYLGPTNTKGSRIKATCYGGSLTVSYNHSLTDEENHILAAYELAVNKMKWKSWLRLKSIASGSLPDGKSCVHVLKAV